VRVAEQLADDQATTGLEHAHELAQRHVLVGNLTQDGDQESARSRCGFPGGSAIPVRYANMCS
jgi:hypothetical protein